MKLDEKTITDARLIIYTLFFIGCGIYLLFFTRKARKDMIEKTGEGNGKGDAIYRMVMLIADLLSPIFPKIKNWTFLKRDISSFRLRFLGFLLLFCGIYIVWQLATGK